MELIDIGVNLTKNVFRGDLAQVLQRAEKAGVAMQVLTGTQVEQSQESQALAAKHGFASTAGVHPHYAKELDDSGLRRLRELCAAKEVVAVGECGLDYNRNFSPREKQLWAFEAQLELAADVGLPVFLHERDAAEDFEAVLKRWRPRLKAAVVHCYTGGPELLKRYLDLDVHIGITGWIADERRGMDLRAAAPLVPTDRLMIETDAPYLLPRNIEPKPSDRRNEPAHLRWVLKALAEVRSEDEAALAQSTTACAKAFFEL